MTLQAIINLKTELEIISESMAIYVSSNYYPSTYSDLLARYNEIKTIKF